MPDTPFAQLYTDASTGKQPKLRQDEKGRWRATTMWLINTAREGRVLSAAGLPRYGDPYFEADVLAAAPGLKVVGVEIAYSHGSDNATTQTGGWSEATVEYAQPEASGSTPLPFAGQKWTEFESSVTATQVYLDIRASVIGTGPYNKPIASGRGVSKDFGSLRAVVYRDLTEADFVALLPRVNALQFEQVVNGAALQLPPILGGSVPYTIGAQVAQYHQFGYDIAGPGVIRVRHVLRLNPVKEQALDGWNGPLIPHALSAHAIYRREGPEGQAYGEPVAARVYPIGPTDGSDFAGLW